MGRASPAVAALAASCLLLVLASSSVFAARPGVDSLPRPAQATAVSELPAQVYAPGVFIVEPPNPFPGAIIKVLVSLPARVGEGTVTLAGRTYKGFVVGGLLTVYVGIDLDVKPGTYTVDYRLGESRGSRKVEIVGREFESESLTVSRAYTQLDEFAAGRVVRENKMLAAIWATHSPQRLWRGAFLKPADGPLGSPFGLRRIFNGKPRSPHAGLDIRATAGSPVHASNHGRVVYAGELFFSGNTVIIDHGLGLYTLYAHLLKMYVKQGGSVERAELIGRVGETGRVTGPHLHWGVKLGGARVGPSMLPGLSL
ncbi:MAG: M23 family metallopeptidase [Deltaproteobacteria bacterium]